MSIKNFFIKKMLSSQMKGVPQSEQDKLFVLIEKNPELFQKIATEADDLMKNGKDQMSAVMEVAKKYEDELKGLM